MSKTLFRAIILSAVLCLVLASPNVRADIRDGLVAYWPLDDAGGTTADELINGLDGSLNGNPTWVAGKVGGALDVDGDGDFVSCGFDPLLMPEEEITLQAWVYVRVYTYYEAIAANIHDTGSSEGGYWLGTYAGGYFGWGVTTVDQTLDYGWTPAIYQENTWYHLVATYKSGEMRLWVNGSLTDGIDSTGMTGNLDYTEAPDEGFLIGRYQDDDETHDSDAIIDEVAVWNRALTADEVSQLWNNGNGMILGKPHPVNPIAPGDGDTTVPVTTDLSWTSPAEFTAQGYNLYFGTEPNDLNPDYDWQKKIDNEIANSWDPPDGLGSGNLEYLTKYYWQVDVYEPNLPGPAIHHVGPIWSFTTAPDTPVVLVDPENQTVAQGRTATFTIEQYNGDDYEWFKVPDTSIGSGICTGPTVTLEINNVQQADEGDYYCVVSNTNGSDTSATAFLITERMVAEWGFELTLDDSVDGHHGTMIGAVTMSYPGPPVVGTYAGGFDGVDDAVEVPYHDTLNNSSFSVALWAKATGGADDYRAAISSRDDGPQKGYIIYAASDNTWQFWTGGSGAGWNANLSSASVVLDEWVYLVGTFEAMQATGDNFVGTQKFYVNGVLAGKDDNVVFTPNDNQRLLIGAGANEDPTPAYFFPGHIDDVQIYNHVLDPYKIAELYTDIRTDETVCVEIDPFDVTGPSGVPDCLVTLLDLQDFAENWLQCNRYPASACVP